MDWDQLVATFKDGDVLYGLDQGRKAAKDAILKAQANTTVKVRFMKVFTRTKKADRIIIQNAITDSVFDALTAGSKLKTGGPILSADKQIKSNKGVQSDPQRAIGFRDHLRNHPKWNVERGISDQDVKGHGWQVNKNASANVDDMDRARKAWTRTSKAGIEYQTKARGCTVHFILDGLDYERVVKKIPGDVTSAEIRWLYRHRSDEQVMNHITFWLDGDVKDAPWLWPTNAAAFAKYQPKSEALTEDHDNAKDLRETVKQTAVSNLVKFWEEQGKRP